METVSFIGSLLKMLFALAIVLGMMIGAMFFMRKILHSTSPATDRESLIRVVATRYLGPKNSIVVVDIAGQMIVLGISNQQMNVLSSITDKEALHRLNNIPAREGFPSVSITKQLAGCKERITTAMSALRK